MNLIELKDEKFLQELHQNGFAILREVLNTDECNRIISMYNQPRLFRKTIVMERYRFGKGEYKYLNYPLPEPIQVLREMLYHQLYETANHWSNTTKEKIKYPAELNEFLSICAANEQTLATPLLLKYTEEGFNTLHQDLYGTIYFPFQAVVLLNEPGKDFTGGEFVITEQIPRAQSKANVLPLKKGDILIFTTHSRPQKGSRGYYRVIMKHGVSKLSSGTRHTLGIIFHDAK